MTVKKKRKSFALGPGAIVSIVFHLGVIIYLLHYVRPSLFQEPPKKMVAVIQMLPPPQQIVTAAPVTTPDIPSVPPQPPPAPPPPPQPVRQVQIGVPSSYFNSLQPIIAQNTQYPPKSVRDQEEGTCKVMVTISRDGSIESVEMKEKAGFPALDSECRNVFNRIVKFPAVPANVSPEYTDFKFELPISFSLQ